ncbi:HNH nuclease domain-containing protein [Vibrio crassostreae]|nr:HNH nuclease domain-containing protein [Vibrio crassostreae]
MSISNPELKKLYGLAAGRCGICKINVFDNDVHIGEMAHIIAKKAKGARGGTNLSGDRNGYDNLILLCANHHTEVDQNPDFYTVEKLHRIKAEHETSVNSLFEAPMDRVNDINYLDLFMKYVPFTRLRYYVEHLPISVKLELCIVGDMFEAHLKDNPHLYPLNDQNLQSYFSSFIDSYYELWSVIAGYTSVDGLQQANFSQADERCNLHMEKRYIPYEASVALSKKLEVLNSRFISAHSGLIEYIRGNYKEVDMNAYRD